MGGQADATAKDGHAIESVRQQGKEEHREGGGGGTVILPLDRY